MGKILERDTCNIAKYKNLFTIFKNLVNCKHHLAIQR